MGTLRKRRYSGAPGDRVEAELVDEDEHGTWHLWRPLAIHVHDDGWVAGISSQGALTVVSHGQSWAVRVTHVGGHIDLVSRIERTGDDVTIWDIELDVGGEWGGAARVVDVDEFDELGLPETDAAPWLAEAERLREAVDRGDAPFGRSTLDRYASFVPPEPLLDGTWMASSYAGAAAHIGRLIGDEAFAVWHKRQAAGEGWMVGGGKRTCTAAVGVSVAGDHEVLATDGTPAGEAMAHHLRAAADLVSTYPPPPIG